MKVKELLAELEQAVKAGYADCDVMRSIPIDDEDGTGWYTYNADVHSVTMVQETKDKIVLLVS